MQRCNAFVCSCAGRCLRFPQGQHGATRVRQHLVNGAVAGEVFKGGSLRGAKDDQFCVALRCLGKNLDGRISVNHYRLDLKAAAGAGFKGQTAQLLHRSRVQAGG